MIRLFIAIPVPRNIRLILSRMGESLPYARAVPEEQLHLTLRFIGDVEGTTFLDLRESLKKLPAPSFDLSIQGVDHFSSRGKPRVIWAGVRPAEPVVQLKRRIDNCLKTCSIANDKRKYSPHITLARLKDTPVRRVSEFLAGNAFLHFDAFKVDSFHLYSSKLTQKGAIHTLEAAYPLHDDATF